MGKIVIAYFKPGETSVRVTGLTQYDYGALLRIQGLNLPQAVEIHFCLQETGGEAPRRVGTTKDGVTDVVIPDSMLDNNDTTQDYSIYAWVYLTDETSGSTERRITMKVRSRSKPEAFPESGETSLASIMAAVNRFAEGKADKLEYKDSILRLLSGEKELSRVTITGGSGGTSREIELRKSDTAIQWRYVGDEDWVDLVALAEIKGEPGTPGKNGEPGKNGVTPHIGDNGNWYIEEEDTGIKARGEDGTDGKDGDKGNDGTTPHIGENNHWWIGDVDTGVDARGKKGNDGDTPRIGENGHWYIGDVDTGVYSRGADGLPGTDGVDGVTPHIGGNKNWWVGETDTGITAEGKDGAPGQDGQPGKSAYQYAQDGGYTGTEEEFAQKLADEYPIDVQIDGTSIVGEDGVADISKLLDETLTHNTKAAPAGEVGKLKGNISNKIDAPSSANVGQIIAVKAVDESGKPIEYEAVNPSSGDATLIDDNSVSRNKTWSSQKISDELNDCVKFVKITVNLIGSEGNIPLGNTVYVYEIVNNIETLSYSSICPTGTIVVRIPHGIQYRIAASADIEGFYAPTEVTGVAINDSEVTIRYTELAYPKTIRDLQILAKMGMASDVVSIGDEFVTTYTYNGTDMEMPWIVTDIKDVEFEDGSIGQGVYLESKYCTIESVQFDASHQDVATEETAIEGLYYIGRTDNTYTHLSLNTGDTIPYSDYTYVYHDSIKDTSYNIYKYGHNRVSTSALRQWLNSDADKGQWWEASKIGYRPPSQLNLQKGFMAGLSQEFIDCVAKVKRTYYTNSVTDGSVIDVLYDKFFSATGTELYGSVNDNEGTYWTYYKEVTGLSSPSNGNNTGRIKYALNAKTSSQYCWTFSSYRGNSYFVRHRGTTGQLDNYYAYNSYRAVPACVIG